MCNNESSCDATPLTNTLPLQGREDMNTGKR